MIDWSDLLPSEPQTEADFAAMRVLGRTTASKSFPLRFGSQTDIGEPTRTVWQVISDDAGRPPGQAGDEEDVTLHESPAGRVQVKARVVRDRGRVTEVRFERIRGHAGRDASIESLVNLDAAATERLINLCLALKGLDPAGSDTLKFDGDILAAVMEDPEASAAAYARDPDRFRALIASDIGATDVVAIAARRRTLQHFEDLLENPDAFARERGAGSSEGVWQRFFEQNPWILGVGLSAHLYTSWDNGKLERTVAGASLTGSGKRVDALLRTSGISKSVVLAEIKLHDDPLLEREEYRSGCWAPSRQVTGAVAQAHITADRARDDIGSWLDGQDEDGYPTGERVYAGVPRSYVVIGRLSSLVRDGRPHQDKVRSFELYRHNMRYPEILTYDEVLARARWSVEQAAGDQ